MNTPDQSPMLGGSTTARFCRWLICRRTLRRLLILLAWLVTLIALFYGEENWRGRRAWEKCRRELEAKGEVLDWNAYIPAPVPAEQNIFKAPKMAEWFVKGSSPVAASGGTSKAGNTNAPFGLSPRWNAKRDPVLLAEVDVVPSNGPPSPGKADAVLRFDDPTAPEQAARLLLQSLGPFSMAVQGGMIVARPLAQINPVHLVVQADTVPTAKALAEFFPRSPVPYNVFYPSDLNNYQISAVGTNAFRLWLKSSVWTAADYLAASQSAVPDLDLLRQALERPCARLEGTYEPPYAQPIPNFVRLRTVAQILSQRAQCYLLLGQPEDAWHELALVRDMCRMLETKPTGNCLTPVQAMIDVAITGLYTSLIEDGLRLQVWREPELAAMQKQLTDINLLPLVRASFNAGRAAVCRTFETYPPAILVFLPTGPPRLWEELQNPRFLFGWLAPRGWVYQNMAPVAAGYQMAIEIFDIPNNLVLPRKADEANIRMQSVVMHRTPYTFLAAIAVPNFEKAVQVMARNQTLVNEAFLACGLERYHLAHGQYPETLEALVLQFAEKFPRDIIGGQPLKYHRTAEGRFVLYSVGWNEKDDGGVPGKTIEEGDWAWQ